MLVDVGARDRGPEGLVEDPLAVAVQHVEVDVARFVELFARAADQEPTRIEREALSEVPSVVQSQGPS